MKKEKIGWGTIIFWGVVIFVIWSSIKDRNQATKNGSGPSIDYSDPVRPVYNQDIYELDEIQDEPEYDPAWEYDATQAARDDAQLNVEELNAVRTAGAKGCPEGCSSPPTGCVIKGNVSIETGAKIYHLPGQKWYAKTKIDPYYGEAWFCTEAEARANGFRKSYE